MVAVDGRKSAAAEQERKRRGTSRIANNNNSSSNTGDFSINDNVDLLAEILGRLDGRSLGIAAFVCRLWSALCKGEAVWERLCNRNVGVGIGEEERSVVAALGGYRRLYRVCLGPVLERMRGPRRTVRRWSRDEAQLSLSLFSVDCYERLAGKRSSLIFLCKAR